jgi:hypothetical protein
MAKANATVTHTANWSAFDRVSNLPHLDGHPVHRRRQRPGRGRPAAGGEPDLDLVRFRDPDQLQRAG